MDRRQRKTREAIFAAFSQLLSERSFSQITVGQIIERADVGRATFYAHFETKDYLLKELCSELFCHIFDSTVDGGCDHRHIFSGDLPGSVFLHLFRHLQKNDHHILDLLSGQNNDLFLAYFRSGLLNLIESQWQTLAAGKPDQLPKAFYMNHIAAAFVQTVHWWVSNQLQESPETITEYFLLSIQAPMNHI